MGPDPQRNFISIVIFWLFIALCVGVLGLGWSLNHTPMEEATRAFFAEVHISLGLSAALLLGVQFLLGVILYLINAGGGSHGGRQISAFWLRQLIYAAFVVTALSGALVFAFRGQQIFFWEWALPLLDAGERSLAETMQTAHWYAACVLAGSILAYVVFALFDWLIPASAPSPHAIELSEPTTIAVIIAEGLAHSFRFFGVVAFWLQLFFGVTSALLLAFSYVGHSVSPNGSGFADSIYWATAAIGLLVLSTLFAFLYSKSARRIRSNPERYLGPETRMAFWFVGAGGLTNILGVLASFGGVGLSVALLIGKTVSQPPGIAITDPQKIIRALDIFILLVNFNLLFAHFIGFGVAAWLSNSALKARHQYVVVSGK